MEYECQTISMNRMIIDSAGFFHPICERCRSLDCSNPIEETEVSILGITKKVKVYNRGSNPRFVVQCKGYMP